MLDSRDIECIRESYAFLVPLQEDAAEAFYHTLFERVPDVRAMFPDDMTEQTGKLWAILVTTVSSLETLCELSGTLRALGKSHVAHGVTASQYGVVAEVLIDTVAMAMGPEFGDEHREAWEKVMSFVSDEMLAGADMAA